MTAPFDEGVERAEGPPDGGALHQAADRARGQADDPALDDPALDELIHRADLDGLVRLIDAECAVGDWAGLLRLRDRTRAAVATGRQLWPAATAGRVPSGAVGTGCVGRSGARRGQRAVHDRSAHRGRRRQPHLR